MTLYCKIGPNTNCSSGKASNLSRVAVTTLPDKLGKARMEGRRLLSCLARRGAATDIVINHSDGVNNRDSQ